MTGGVTIRVTNFSIAQDMTYIYRIVFSFVGDPDKIPLPFVRYKPGKAIFNFETILKKEDRDKIVKIAKTLNRALGHPVEFKEESFVDNNWTLYNRSAKIDKPITD